jgi:radical SAM protein with 4Fe4S-binding SPASM domain
VTLAALDRIGALNARAARERIPLDGSIELTHRCNLRCIHCYLGPHGEGDATGGELSADEWCGIIDQLAAAGTLRLTITGGEPLLRRDFPAVYEKAVLGGMLVSVYTNATLVDAETVCLLRKLPPKVVEVTIHGGTAATHDGISRVPGSFERCLEGVRLLRGRGVRVNLKTVLMTLNAHELDLMEHLAASLGTPFRHDAALFPPFRGPLAGDRDALERLRLQPRDVARLDSATENRRAPWIDAFHPDRERPATRRLLLCSAGLTTFNIDPRGMLSACLLPSGAAFDLRCGSFGEGWNGPVAAARRREARGEFSCSTCGVDDLCGGCPPLFALETGAPDRVADYHCRCSHERFAALAPYLRAAAPEEGGNR